MTTSNPPLTWQYVSKWAERRPDDEALVFGERRVSWRELAEQVDALAAALLDAGVARGDRVALLAMACPEFLVAFMAASRVGAIWLGLSPKYTRRELAVILRDAAPAVLLSLREYGGRDLSEDLLALRAELPVPPKLVAIGEPFDGAEAYDFLVRPARPELNRALEARAAEGRPEDPVLLMYTSGSTGVPKGVMHTHRSVIASVETQNACFGTDETTRALLHFPINHVAADVELGFAAIHAGATLVLMDRFDPVAALEAVQRERITLFGQAPAMFLLQLGTPEFARTDFSSVRTFAWGGTAAPRRLIDALAGIAEKTGARLMTGYGSTEAGGFVTYSGVRDSLDTLAATAGRAVPPTELRIVDANRLELPDGQPGEIALRGPTLMRGYWNNPVATAEAMDSLGWYYTGDIAWRDDSGAIHIVGRTSEMYKTGGENVYPREVEEVLEAHPAVAIAAVIGVPDELYQEAGLAFVVPKDQKSVTPEELRAHCRASLANFKVPKRFVIRSRLPLLATGKVDKVALRNEA